ncbi:MAG: signal peptidase II [Deltaproteobacteria bacterium]|nr:signal peptidase II [Deltaproteobacteria bacterium]
MRTRLLLLLAVLVPCVACDQATKTLALTHLKGAPALALDAPPLLARLVYAENPGAFLGMGRSLPEGVRVALLAVGVALMLAVMIGVLLRRELARAPALGMALLVAGGVGNLVDRVVRPGGRVVDFAQLGVQLGPLELRTGVFNVADLAIVAGALLLAWAALRHRQRQRHS